MHRQRDFLLALAMAMAMAMSSAWAKRRAMEIGQP